MAAVTQKQKDEVISNFRFEDPAFPGAYGSGHINDTFLLEFEIAEMGRLKVILQRMNREVFKKPVELMENIMGVTSYLRERIIENGGDPERETLNVIPNQRGKALLSGFLRGLLAVLPVYHGCQLLRPGGEAGRFL